MRFWKKLTQRSRSLPAMVSCIRPSSRSAISDPFPVGVINHAASIVSENTFAGYDPNRRFSAPRR
jgi:hypothetical protein